MMPDTKTLDPRLLVGGVQFDIGKVQAGVSWKLSLCHLLYVHRDGTDTNDLLFPGHCWPSLV